MSTVTPTQPLVSPPATLLFTPRRITVDEYERIIASGSLNEPKKVNLVDRRVEVYTGPGPAGYASRKDFPAGQQVPVVIDGRPVGQVAVDDILP
jgi:hypothetical protein